MGWQDRDWAKWTDEERERFLGDVRAPVQIRGGWTHAGHARLHLRSPRIEVTLLAVLASLAVSLVGWQLDLFRLPIATHPAGVAPAAPVVYGTGLAHSGTSQLTCTAVTTDARDVESCTDWTILLPGQRAVEAMPLPVGTTCRAVVADQRSGHWVCSAATTS